MGGYDVGCFVAHAIASGAVWALRSDDGFEATELSDGARAMPFWSTLAHAARSCTQVPEFEGRLPVRIELNEWLSRWLPMLADAELLVGVDWLGPLNQGFEVSPTDLRDAFAACEGLHMPPALNRDVTEPY